MPTIDWPLSLVPAKSTWGLQSNTEAFTSPLNRSVQTVERPGARWKASWEFPPKNDFERGLLEAFLASLGGMAGRFTVWPHQRPGNSLYSPMVNGNLTDFRMLPSFNWAPNAVVLRAGDYIAAGGELKIVTADVATNAIGLATIPVSPPFRKQPGNLAPITTDRPRATMMLASDEYSISVLPGRISDAVVISAVEVFL
ncbi:hypothetical protein [Cupriavidus sp. H18C2]|uniref:hypothetical protein n=1 Tax=Cupriavidus sp. H18C2 TaxID=3241602 RepID=UPI003BF78DAC